MKKLIVVFLFINSIFCFAQKEASNWYFGNNAGITFNNDGSVTTLSDGKLSTIEGCATISDKNGNLLFYTDGITVYNRNHTVMERGLFGDPSSTQSAIIVPKPGDPNIYYIFTIDTTVRVNDTDFGFNYSIVDMTLNSGLGEVTLKNSNLLEDSSEKISAVVKDCISQSIWVITLADPTGAPTNIYNTFHAFEISTTGINTKPVSSSFPDLNIDDQRGYLKLSPDGTKMACANPRNGLYLFDFDASTGIVSSESKLNIIGRNRNPYGVDFSPNSQLLYVHASNDFFDFDNPSNNNIPSNHSSSLIQYNILSSNIDASAIIIDDRQLYRGGLQLGPDGKIYRALSATYNSGTSHLGVIKDPNNLGLACNYIHNAINLAPNTSSQGLPPFITSFFSEKIDIIDSNSNIFSTSLSLCDEDTYTLTSPNISGATYIWKRNNVILPENDFDLIVSQDGLYEVFIAPNTGECDKNLEGQAKVTFNTNPVAYNYTLIQCDEDGISGGFTRFNLNEATTHLTGNIEGLSVKFYTDTARTNEIINTNSYNYNADNPKAIYIKVIDDLTNCFDTSELTLNLNITQFNSFTASPLCDEINSEDGINTFNLNDITSEIQSLNNITFPIIYYETYDDALLEKNGLGTSFINTNPYTQTIYARIENENNCFGISEVYLTINKLPEIEIEDFSYYCLNKYPKTITINAGLINDSPSNYSYNWSTGEVSYNIEINKTGTYNVTITNKFTGCSKYRTITVEPSNTATYNNINIVDVSINNTITVFVSGEGTYEFGLLNENNILLRTYQESNIFENVSPGIYTVIVNDIKNNCGSVPQKVSVIGFPKVFTPNGDGFNDTWQVQGVSGMFQPKSKILIFNRFGKLIKELDPLGEGWNGLFNGEVLPSDDYWFYVTLQDGRIFKNHFTLKH
ncbi:T9SS type B sorting domain-containing protein [Thalassobellus sediminis]|uniref:T9SS type B sorting domain-containing protein n=1 Tax=Thalassobellus sediminis TaxID=3367753 RepID=UPI0037AEAD3E